MEVAYASAAVQDLLRKDVEEAMKCYHEHGGAAHKQGKRRPPTDRLKSKKKKTELKLDDAPAQSAT